MKNLYESVRFIAEDSLPQKLEKELNLDSDRASDIVKELNFTTYVEVANALDTGDIAKAQEILGLGVTEADDFTKAKVTDVRPHDKLTYQDDKGRETTVDLRDPDHELGLAAVDSTGQRPAKDDRGEDITPNEKEIERGDELIVDLDEMKKLAGIPIAEDCDKCKTCDGEGVMTDSDSEQSPCPDCAIEETTCAGGIATVAMPMGKKVKRRYP